MNDDCFGFNDKRYFSTLEEYIGDLAEQFFEHGETPKNFMYGNHAEDDDEIEYDLYGENYCEVEFTDCSRGRIVTIADFDIESFREEGTKSLSFNDGVLCGIKPDSVFSITRLSEQEYLDIVG